MWYILRATLITSISAHISIPLIRGVNETFYIPNAIVPGVFRANASSSFNVTLSFCDRSHINRGDHDTHEPSLLNGIQLENGLVLVPRSGTDFSTDFYPTDHTVVFISVRRGGNLVREFNTVDISTRSGTLILKDTREGPKSDAK